MSRNATAGNQSVPSSEDEDEFEISHVGKTIFLKPSDDFKMREDMSEEEIQVDEVKEDDSDGSNDMNDN